MESENDRQTRLVCEEEGSYISAGTAVLYSNGEVLSVMMRYCGDRRD